MVREILFKAKRKNWRELPKGEWNIVGIAFYEIDPETICQYTRTE